MLLIVNKRSRRGLRDRLATPMRERERERLLISFT